MPFFFRRTSKMSHAPKMDTNTTDLSENCNRPTALALAPCSARMTLMRGTPKEIERDLIAIDEKMAELKHREKCAHAAFVYEKEANVRLEKEIQRLRDVLCSIASAGGFDNIGNWARAEAKKALWPNKETA